MKLLGLAVYWALKLWMIASMCFPMQVAGQLIWYTLNDWVHGYANDFDRGLLFYVYEIAYVIPFLVGISLTVCCAEYVVTRYRRIGFVYILWIVYCISWFFVYLSHFNFIFVGIFIGMNYGVWHFLRYLRERNKRWQEFDRLIESVDES
jgi:hypothetical protein